MKYKAFYSSPLGQLFLQSDGENLTALKIQNDNVAGGCQNDDMIQDDKLEIL